MIMEGLMAVLQPYTIALVAVGVVVGIIFGSIPGLTATMAIVMFLPVTYAMQASEGISMLVALYIGGISGGLISAILLNIPGTPSSAATALEGFPLTKQGHGIKAGVMVTTASCMGAMIGLIILLLLAEPVSKAALMIGYWEFFWLGMFGIVICGSMTAEKPYKGLISGMLGLFISCIGIDGIYGTVRFTFGVSGLRAGISLVPAMVGLFGLSEAISALADPESHTIANVGKMTVKDLLGYVKESFVMLKNHFRLFITSSVLGTLIGAVPGTGGGVAYNADELKEVARVGLDMSPIITHRFHYTEFQKGFDAMNSGMSGKVVLDWSK